VEINNLLQNNGKNEEGLGEREEIGLLPLSPCPRYLRLGASPLAARALQSSRQLNLGEERDCSQSR